VGVLALAVGEDKTSIETSDETNKEDLSPEASGKRKYANIITSSNSIICDLLPAMIIY
jgi:hypothetical protein